ncbi:SAM-dependent methyltransferase [Arthrobacter sp. NicSoilB4]|uniref:class I SAM-dependent methyltransferase n=1 Tax=Arthrobacter sp. NicSoilB4 TaxID=2830997 RepID=UPI001CC4B1F4|nr:class I SAM-dependent methyltransferase [Arthrobacter sp. NicSoilB4]BCW68558.1 SAM-dependent methyltransferase [Arthrobacter sp. NicSoilB4]
MNDAIREYWDGQAADFDREADHGLLDPGVRRAWADLILPLIPLPGSDVADLGCGTGSLSMLLAGAGHRVRGLDLSARMVDAARAKAAGAAEAAGGRLPAAVEFLQGDASAPPYAQAGFDVVLARHVLWALPDPDAALGRWTRLLRGPGTLVLVEGMWGTGAGIPSNECRELVLRHRHHADVVPLTDPALWGKEISDERYLILSRN